MHSGPGFTREDAVRLAADIVVDNEGGVLVDRAYTGCMLGYGGCR